MKFPFWKKKRSNSDQEARLSDIPKILPIKSDQTARMRSRKLYTSEEEARLSDMIKEGQSLEAISLEFKRSKSEISNKKYKMKIQKRSRNENVKLRKTNSDLEAIKENLKSDIAKLTANKENLIKNNQKRYNGLNVAEKVIRILNKS